ATLEVDLHLAPGKEKNVRFNKLPKGAVLAVRVRTDGPLAVLLVAAAELRNAQPQAMFRGSVERSISFQVEIPATGDYLLVLDNRRGTTAVEAHATLQARRPGKFPPKPPPGESRT
ncbi:MAG: hypothetical protein ACREVQ_06740, partial [Burkholderiales bacterium]